MIYLIDNEPLIKLNYLKTYTQLEKDYSYYKIVKKILRGYLKIALQYKKYKHEQEILQNINRFRSIQL